MSCLTHPDACNVNEQCALNIENGNYTCICPQGFTSFNGNCNRKLYLYKVYLANVKYCNHELIIDNLII